MKKSKLYEDIYKIIDEEIPWEPCSCCRTDLCCLCDYGDEHCTEDHIRAVTYKIIDLVEDKK